MSKNRLIASYLNMVLLSAATFGVVSCQMEAVPVLHTGLDTPRFTRYTMRGYQSGFNTMLFRSNFLAHNVVFEPGKQIKIIQYSEVRMDLTINEISCQMFFRDQRFPTDPKGIDEFLDKHFAKSVEAVNMQPSKESWQHIVRGTPALRMTKEEVLMAIGYPSHIGSTQIPADTLNRDRILESNVWNYRVNEIMLIPIWRNYQFNEEGKLHLVVD